MIADAAAEEAGSAAEFEWRLAGVSSWHVPMVSVVEFAAMLGLAVGSVRQYVSKEDGFPVPAGVGRRGTNLWTLAQVYEYCASSAVGARGRGGIPRVYPRWPAGSGGARAGFVAAECIPGIYRFLSPLGLSRPPEVPVVHYWAPGDGRGMLAVVYLAGDAVVDRWGARDLAACAARYLHECGVAATAVVITDEDDRPVPDCGAALQPRVVVAEVASVPVWVPSNAVTAPSPGSGRSWRPSQLDLAADPAVSVYDVGLFDLRYLLRRDLPWWPAGGRAVAEIANWKPGRPIDDVRRILSEVAAARPSLSSGAEVRPAGRVDGAQPRP